MRLEGKVALITGAARGMGAAEALLFAKEGASVIICDILTDQGKEIERTINSTGQRSVFRKLDVTNEENWNSVVKEAITVFGHLDILVNNAGISGSQWGQELCEEAWDDIMGVNATGVFLGTKSIIPEMSKQTSGGSIINISSQLGIVGSDFTHPAYNASKGAVRSLTKAIAIRYAPQSIRCNSVHPGPIDTPMAQGIFTNPELMTQTLNKIPMGRQGHPDEVATVVLYLASDESSYVTGAEVIVDGGWTAL